MDFLAELIETNIAVRDAIMAAPRPPVSILSFPSYVGSSHLPAI